MSDPMADVSTGDDVPDTWVLLRMSTTTLWLPERGADDLAVQVSHVRRVDPTATAWEPEALVPDEDWQGVRGDGEARVVDDAAFDTGRDVGLVRLPAPDRDVPWIAHELGPVGRVDQYIGVLDDAPGRATQTVRGQGGRRMGLHLDNWDRLPASARRTSRNRASLNLGPEPRWFLFADVDVVASHEPDEVPDTESTRARLDEPAPPTVVRVLVPPGWAYVAPTENLLHDVCTLGQRKGTSHASALGRFSPTHTTSSYTAIAVDVAQRTAGQASS